MLMSGVVVIKQLLAVEWVFEKPMLIQRTVCHASILLCDRSRDLVTRDIHGANINKS